MQSRPRILVFLSRFMLGGAQKQGALLARYLKQAGYEVSVWGFPSPTTHTPLRDLLVSWGVPCTQLGAWPTLDWRSGAAPLLSWRRWTGFTVWRRNLSALAAALPEGKFEVVVPFTFWPCLVAVLMRHRLGADTVLWNHRGGFDNAGIDYSPFLVRAIMRAHPLFMANSQAGARFLQETFALPLGGARVIHNVYAPETDATVRPAEEPLLNERGLHLLHVANLLPEKDAGTLIRAVGLLRRRGVPAVLHLVGDIPDAASRSTLEHSARSCGVEENVLFYGAMGRAQVSRLLSQSHIGLLSSRSEGLPNSVMEYMYAGLPVVGTDIPGIREVLGDGCDGFLFPVGDAEKLAEIVESLANHSELRVDIGRRNRCRIEKVFSQSVIMPQWLDLLGLPSKNQLVR